MSKDGGPAFPLNTPKWHEQVSDQGSSGDVDFTMGMTMRDYFAAKAMAALIMEPPFCEGESPAVTVWDNRDDGQPGLERFAYVAYRVADAMIAAMAKP
jgi:hypothetical protein